MTGRNTKQEDAWVAEERAKVIAYLADVGIDHLGVDEWPAFHFQPFFAIWAVQSKKSPGTVGWWIISGDVPTDYLSGSGAQNPKEVAAYFSRQWAEAADFMLRNEEQGDVQTGQKEDWPSLAPLLKTRSQLLGKIAANDRLWG